MENLIEHIQKFVLLSDEDIFLLRNELQVVPVKKKEHLLQQGELCQASYFVSRGCLRMYYLKDSGTEQITQFAIENWWLTDHMALITGEPSSFSIQAVEDTEIISWNNASAEELFQKIPSLERYFRLVLQRAYAASQFRIKFLYGFTREELYHHFSSHFPDFVQRVPQYMLASYLGFTPEYLSEIRKKIH